MANRFTPSRSTGNETVLDALSKINGLPSVSSKKRIWVARATTNCDHPEILPGGLVRRHAAAATRRPRTTRSFPAGDRIYVDSDKWIRNRQLAGQAAEPGSNVILGSDPAGQQHRQQHPQERQRRQRHRRVIASGCGQLFLDEAWREFRRLERKGRRSLSWAAAWPRSPCDAGGRRAPACHCCERNTMPRSHRRLVRPSGA